MDGPVVKTPLGQLQGSILVTELGKTIYTFLGVPYAKPPVGNLRFKDPVPAERWNGIKSAQKSPPLAPTALMLTPKGFVIDVGDEDCLYLNIFTPESPTRGKNLPVMVWIHGGGFANGTGNLEWYGPDYLVPKGVILVSINYRLGALGFLSFENKECPGNFGLKDQSLGLKWIQQNIEYFGGDPKNVTIFGQSAGSAAVTYHMLSPMSRGLFHRAIAQSGAASNGWAFTQSATQRAFTLAKRLGYTGANPHEAFEHIRQTSNEDILKVSGGIIGELEGVWAGENIFDLTFVPTVEPKDYPNAFLTKTPEQALADGDLADVPFLYGVCEKEMLLGLPRFDLAPDWNNDIGFQKVLPKGFAELGSEKMSAAAKKLKEFYFPNGPTHDGYVQVLSFTKFVRGILQTSEAHLKKKSANYAYVFKVAPENSAVKRLLGISADSGVCHGEELEYLFRVREGMIAGKAFVEGSKDARIRDFVTKLWTNFAKTGNPSSDWPVASKGWAYADITEKIVPKANFYQEENKVWDEIFAIMQS